MAGVLKCDGNKTSTVRRQASCCVSEVAFMTVTKYDLDAFGIPNGSKLRFIGNEAITAIKIGPNTVRYDGKEITLSRATVMATGKPGNHPCQHWMVSLHDLWVNYDRVEQMKHK
jgi:hypothetical protein